MRKADIGSVALALFGIYLMLSGFRVLQSVFTGSISFVSGDVDYLEEVLKRTPFAALAALAAALLFSVVPGFIIYKKSRSWGQRLFPDDDQEFATNISRRGLLWVGVILLGANFVLSGLVTLVPAVATLVSGHEFQFVNSIGQLTGSFLSVIGGAVLIYSRHWIGME